ncbi:MAG: hypothetical protein WBA74_09065 [Cyclobacteriaceae bacterium]
MTSKKIYQIGFVIIVLINAVLIFLLVSRPQRPSMNPGERQGSIIEKISNRLELSEDQKAKYQLMAGQHGEQMRKLDSDYRALLKAYFETLDDKSVASDENIKNELLKIEAEKLQYTYTHFEELKSILSEPQKAHFKLIIRDILIALIGDRNKPRPLPRN